MLFQDFTNDVGRKAATLKESGLSRPFSRVGRRFGEFSAGDVAGSIEFAVAAIFGNGIYDLLGADAAPRQLETEPGGAEAGCLGAHVGVGEAGVGEEAEFDESVQLGIHFVFATKPGQLAGEFRAGMLSLGEAAQCSFVQAHDHGHSALDAR